MPPLYLSMLTYAHILLLCLHTLSCLQLLLKTGETSVHHGLQLHSVSKDACLDVVDIMTNAALKTLNFNELKFGEMRLEAESTSKKFTYMGMAPGCGNTA